MRQRSWHALMEFVNAESTGWRALGGLNRRSPVDPFEALAESLVRGGVLSAQDAATMSSGNAKSAMRQRVMAESTALRAALRSALETAAAGAELSSMQIVTINAVLDARRSDVRLVASSGSLEWGAESADPITQALTLITLDGVALLTSPEELSRVRRCAGLNCDRLFIDHTKNRSGRWCDMRGCGNRAKARRFHERRRTLSLPGSEESQADGVP